VAAAGGNPGFGAAQGNGQVWLGTANGVVQSWSDSLIVAQVGAGAASGNAQVLQNNVMSNAVSFTVNVPQIASVSPASGVGGTSVTFTGAGFGASPGVVWLGSMAGQVVSWTDAQVVATVALSAVSGIARIQTSGGLWSNAMGFTVPAAGGNTIVPSMLNMVVGDTRTLQALGPGGQAVTGLTWASSDPTVVSLSTDDPPVLTAVAAGHVTITAGTGSADVTVSAVALAVGTVIWSNPGDGSGVAWIVPAVPSASGVADVFAYQNDGMVQAITSDGTVAWTANIGPYKGPREVLPDFQGGLVVVSEESVYKLDGMTGQAYPVCSGPGGAGFWGLSATSGNTMVVHPDGTILGATNGASDYPTSVFGIDPTTCAVKFSVPGPYPPSDGNPIEFGYSPIIAGDGYAYFPYSYSPDTEYASTRRIGVMRVSSSGAYDNIDVYDVGGAGSDEFDFSVNMVTNADQGILITWSDWTGPHMATITGTSVSQVNAPSGELVYQAVQAQDGSFVGADWDGNMMAFDASGNVRWVVPNEQPAIATADGGVIGQSGITYDANGNATGQMGSLPTYSWFGYGYQVGSVDQVLANPLYLAASWWPFSKANNSANVAAVLNARFPPLPSCYDNGGKCPGPLGPRDLLWNAKNDLVNQLVPNSACSAAAQVNVFGRLKNGDLYGKPITRESFVRYLQNQITFYNGATSTLDMAYALCPEGNKRTFCPGNTQTVEEKFADTSQTTAVTITPSYPFKSFWQPTFTSPETDSQGNVLYDGFGDGVDPRGLGINIYNESNLLHEALHGMTGLYDDELVDALGAGGGSFSISIYIKDNVLSKCPISAKGRS